MLELIDLTVRRGPNPVVTGLHLTIRPGTVFWVVGPNGAGKTSLLRVLAGLDRPRSGSVVRRAASGEVFLYFQSEMTVPPTATVGDWDCLVRRLLPPAVPGRRSRLWPGAGRRRRVGRLSTGERKRLLLDALFRRPGPLLLDEPFEHLSPDAKAELGRLIVERARARVVVVATNQATGRAARGPGLRLDGGEAAPLAEPPGRGPAGAGVEPEPPGRGPATAGGQAEAPGREAAR
jgi:ABC-type multidrug transport system ATPase subunit